MIAPLHMFSVASRVTGPFFGMLATANSMTKGYLGAAGLVVCYALSAVLDTQFCLRLGRLQLHVRASIVTAVYR